MRHQPGAPVIATPRETGQGGNSVAGLNGTATCLPTRGVVPLSFVACVSDDSLLEANLLASPCIAGPGSPHEAILIHEAPSAAAGLTMGLMRANHHWVVYAHQDVYLPEGWDRCLFQQIQEAERRFGPIGVAGVYGVGPPAGLADGDGEAVRQQHRFDEWGWAPRSLSLPIPGTSVFQPPSIRGCSSLSFAGNGIDAGKLLDENARQFAHKWGLPGVNGRRVALRPWNGNGESPRRPSAAFGEGEPSVQAQCRCRAPAQAGAPDLPGPTSVELDRRPGLNFCCALAPLREAFFVEGNRTGKRLRRESQGPFDNDCEKRRKQLAALSRVGARDI